MTEKPRGKAPQAPAKDSDAGHLGVDDRGNVTWEWNQEEPDLVADDTLGAAERVRALVDPRLQVKDEEEDPLNPVQSNPKGLKSGYTTTVIADNILTAQRQLLRLNERGIDPAGG